MIDFRIDDVFVPFLGPVVVVNRGQSGAHERAVGAPTADCLKRQADSPPPHTTLAPPRMPYLDSRSRAAWTNSGIKLAPQFVHGLPSADVYAVYMPHGDDS